MLLEVFLDWGIGDMCSGSLVVGVDLQSNVAIGSRGDDPTF